MRPPLLQLSRIGKVFGGHRVLDEVSFDLQAGEVHLLAGENGAGKSTLIKVLAGVHPEHDGTITLDGRPVRCGSPQEAARHGIAVIHQELSLVGTMSVEENLLLGREPARGGGWWLDRRAMRRQAIDLCRQLALDFTAQELGCPVGPLALSVKSRIEIARALAGDARILVMDEPTSALNRAEVDRLFALIAALRRRGCGIIYISHKMEEIYRVADRITVLRDGRRVGTARAADCPERQLVRWMIGREAAPGSGAEVPAPAGAPRLELRAVRVPDERPGRPDVVRELSLCARVGEIVGLAGLQDAGGSELLKALSGARGPVVRGEVRIDGEPFIPRSPRAAIARGLAHLTADRKDAGFIPGLDVAANVTLASLPRLSRGGWLRPALERARARGRTEALRLRCRSLRQPVETLSGGNQQKVVLAKWLETGPRVLLLDEPTRGIDLGAKAEIHALMRQWAAAGMTIVFHSTELPELLGVADRVLVLRSGRIAGEFPRGTEAGSILAAAMGAAADGVRS